MSFGWWTESNAFEKSIAIAAVRFAGFCCLNPVAIAVVREREQRCYGRIEGEEAMLSMVLV